LFKNLRIAIIFIVSLAIWILFRWKEPEAPLGATETLVVVIAVSVIACGAEWLIKRFVRKSVKPV
jgi:hypothetical protein